MRNRVRAQVNSASQGQRRGKCRVRRRAERVSRPAREKNRRRRVLVVATCSPRPMRAVQRARFVSHNLYRQLNAVGGEAARREMVETDAVLEVADSILDLGVAAMVCLEIQGVVIPVSDEGVIAVGGEQGQLRAGRGLNPPDDKPHRHGVGLTLEGDDGLPRPVSSPKSRYKGTGVQLSWGMPSMRFRRLACCRTVMEKRTSIMRQTATMAGV